MLRVHFSRLSSETTLKHVPILNAQVTQEERVVGVCVEVGTVAAGLAGVEVVRAPDYRAVLCVRRVWYRDRRS